MKISILGDSISTYEGCHSSDCNIYYEGYTNEYAQLKSWKDTWWGIVIEELHGTLLKNHSYSGGCITATSEQFDYYPSAISPLRYQQLKNKDHIPDIIFVYLGINDWFNEVTIEQQYTTAPWYTCFKEASEYLCTCLKKEYPDTKICVISPILGTIDGYLLPSVNGDGVSLKRFQTYLEEACEKANIHYLNIHKHCPYYQSMDGAHPDKKGMRQLAEAILKEFKAINQ